MAETGGQWLIEHGIGEDRALLVKNDQVLAARLNWHSKTSVGTVLTAKVVARATGSSRALCITNQGIEINASGLSKETSEGSEARLIITRDQVAERGRLKRASARYLGDEEAPAAPPSIFTSGKDVSRFPSGLWEEVWDAASSGSLDFAGGSIQISTTPAMTLIDVDGEGHPRELALAAVPAIARAIHWFDLGGNIGIDFPTIQDKPGRKAVDAALAKALTDWPHERTAMNGFGFVQLVAQLTGPSFLHRFTTSRTGMCVRMALRRGEMAEGMGRILLLTVHPALKAKLKDDWLDELTRRTGKEVRIETNPALALEEPQAQVIES